MNSEEQELRMFYVLKYGQNLVNLWKNEPEMYFILKYGSLEGAFRYYNKTYSSVTDREYFLSMLEALVDAVDIRLRTSHNGNV